MKPSLKKAFTLIELLVVTPAKPARELSAEEQMAQYEESLKETDWGHQPC